MAGCSSIFILTSLTAPLAERTTLSRTGVSCLHGPHHGAQKSTSTGCRRDSSITSFLKVCVVVSLTRPSAVAAATPTFIQFDLSLSCLHPTLPCNRGRVGWRQGPSSSPRLNGAQQSDCNRNFTATTQARKRFRCVLRDRRL